MKFPFKTVEQNWESETSEDQSLYEAIFGLEHGRWVAWRFYAEECTRERAEWAACIYQDSRDVETALRDLLPDDLLNRGSVDQWTALSMMQSDAGMFGFWSRSSSDALWTAAKRTDGTSASSKVITELAKLVLVHRLAENEDTAELVMMGFDLGIRGELARRALAHQK